MLSAQKADVPILNAVAASIEIGRGAQLYVSDGGHLENTIQLTIAAIQQLDEEEQTQQSAAPGSVSTGAGSGFFVSNQGHVLTNQHVVPDCETIHVDGAPARLVASSAEFDLAILQTQLPGDKSFASFSPAPAPLNSDVTAIGFPYAGQLSGLNVTRGSVSALVGLNGEGTQLQVTAPVQSGNSGGPLVGPMGAVVGVVVSKLNALAVEDTLGDLPQNVNFAVRGGIAKLYLSQHGVTPSINQLSEKLDPVQIAAEAQKFTVFVECN